MDKGRKACNNMCEATEKQLKDATGEDNKAVKE